MTRAMLCFLLASHACQGKAASVPAGLARTPNNALITHKQSPELFQSYGGGIVGFKNAANGKIIHAERSSVDAFACHGAFNETREFWKLTYNGDKEDTYSFRSEASDKFMSIEQDGRLSTTSETGPSTELTLTSVNEGEYRICRAAQSDECVSVQANGSLTVSSPDGPTFNWEILLLKDPPSDDKIYRPKSVSSQKYISAKGGSIGSSSAGSGDSAWKFVYVGNMDNEKTYKLESTASGQKIYADASETDTQGIFIEPESRSEREYLWTLENLPEGKHYICGYMSRRCLGMGQINGENPIRANKKTSTLFQGNKAQYQWLLEQ